MNLPLKIFLIYMIVINFIAIIVTIHDKKSAMKNKWRVPERTLLIVSGLGGSVMMFFTMKVIRHKTKHLKFMLGIPIIFILQCVLIFYLWRMFYGG
ncbi:MAG: DUF1294 domain-containing protein [Ruminococcus sp.]|nr:DUF1294 domain-containing protein [Ruminococcus sp.]